MTVEIRFVKSEPWLGASVTDPSSVKRTLGQAGFTRREVLEIMKDYEEIVAQVNREIDYAIEHSDDPVFQRYRDLHEVDPLHRVHGQVDGEVAALWAREIRRRLGDLFNRYRQEIIATEETLVKIPLFKFHSPVVKNSEVILEEIQSQGYATSWLVTVFGSGMGGAETYSVKFLDSYSSTGGDYKLIFIPVPVRIHTVKKYRNNEFVGQGIRAEVVKPEEEKQYHKGIEQISAGDFMKDNPGVEKKEEIFPLAGDKSSVIHTHQRTWQFEKYYEPKIGLKALDTEISVAAKVIKSGSFSLTFKLPAGRDYHLRKLRNGYGFYWEVKED